MYRRFWLVLAVFYLACGGSLCSGPPIPTSELRFFTGGGCGTPMTIFGDVTTVGEAHYGTGTGGGITDFTPVPTTPMPFNVDFTASNLPSHANTNIPAAGDMEAHLYTSDLPTLNDAIATGLPSGGPVVVYDNLVGPTGSLGGDPFGGDIVLPFAPNSGWPLSNRNTIFSLSSAAFWPSAAPVSPGSDPTGTGSVKNAIIVRTGLCHADIPLTNGGTGAFDQIASQIPVLLKTTEQKILAAHDTWPGDYIHDLTLSILYLRITPLINPPSGNGFFLYTEITGRGCWDPNSTLCDDIDLSANYTFPVSLSPYSGSPDPYGILNTSPCIGGRPGGTADCPGGGPIRNDISLATPMTHSVPLEWNKALDETAPARINSIASQALRVTIGSCDAGGLTTTAQGILGAGVISGAAALGVDATTVAAQINDASNWTCQVAPNTLPAPGPGCPSGNCAQFILKAKRMALYPDAVHLVWFDVADASDPMYALYVALVGQGGALKGADSKLCAPTSVSGGATTGTGIFRPLVTAAVNLSAPVTTSK